MSVRADRRGGYILDTRWPDGMRTRRRILDKAAAIEINQKIVISIKDEDRIWKKLRKSLRLERNQIHDVSDLVKRYIEEYVMMYNQDVRHKKAHLAAFAGFMGDVSAERIDLSAVSRFLATIKSGGLENATVNRYREAIAHMTRWAVDQGIFERNPLAKLQKLKEPEYYRPRPESRIIDAVFNEIKIEVRPIFCFLRETGCRKGEAISLRHDQIDYSRQIVTFHTSRRRQTQTKSGKTRQVPLTAKALAAIQVTPKHGSKVFYNHLKAEIEPWRDRTLDAVWERSRNRAATALPLDAYLCLSLRMHDLRHAYAITLAENGCEMHFISEVMGHHSMDFTRRRYARFSPDSAVQRVRAVLQKAENGVQNG